MIHVLIGTRAQLIKMIPLMHRMQEKKIPYNFILMAQHRETIYEILDDFSLKHPDYVLCDNGKDVVRTVQMIFFSIRTLFHGIVKRDKVFKGDKAGLVLVHGDAPPVFLGAVLAKTQGLSVAVIESGLRSFNFLKPFPEELTRVVIGRFGLADFFFCQDEAAMRNIVAYKGIAYNTRGNTIIDAIRLSTSINNTAEDLDEQWVGDKYAIVTVHRFESLSNRGRLSLLVDLITKVSMKINIVFILHPPTKEALLRTGLYQKLDHNDRISLIPRLTFISFSKILSRAEFIVTDGGSNQEEAAYLGIPCLLFRTETERQDGIGRNVVLSYLDHGIVADFIDNYDEYGSPPDINRPSPTQIILDEVIGITQKSDKR